MNFVSDIRKGLESLHPGMAAAEFERAQRELLVLVSQVEQSFVPVSAVSDGPHRKLSRREREVMEMILGGQRLKEIAARLDISVKTVTTHRSRLLKKLRLEDNLGLYRYGVRNGLIAV